MFLVALHPRRGTTTWSKTFPIGKERPSSQPSWLRKSNMILIATSEAGARTEMESFSMALSDKKKIDIYC